MRPVNLNELYDAYRQHVTNPATIRQFITTQLTDPDRVDLTAAIHIITSWLNNTPARELLDTLTADSITDNDLDLLRELLDD